MTVLLGNAEINSDSFKDLSNEKILSELSKVAMDIYDNKKETIGEEFIAVQKRILLKTVDSTWIDNIETLTNLRKYVSLQSYNQKDPIVGYTSEASEIFNVMMYNLQKNVVRYIMNIKINTYI